jgi:hypothetical protein
VPLPLLLITDVLIPPLVLVAVSRPSTERVDLAAAPVLTLVFLACSLAISSELLSD